MSLYPFRGVYLRGIYHWENQYQMFLLVMRSGPVIRSAVCPGDQILDQDINIDPSSRYCQCMHDFGGDSAVMSCEVFMPQTPLCHDCL